MDKQGFLSSRKVLLMAISAFMALGIFLTSVLVEQPQIIERQAVETRAKAWFLPADTPSIGIGDRLPVDLVVDFNTLKAAGFTLKINFPSSVLRLRPDDITISNFFYDPNLGIGSVITKQVLTNYALISAVFSPPNPPGNIVPPTGLINPLVGLNFTLLREGVARILVDEVYEHHEVVGYLPDNSSVQIDLYADPNDSNKKIEAQYVFGSSACPGGAFGNLDCDSQGKIDETDLNIFLSSWSPQGLVPTPISGFEDADLNDDGKVDEMDLNILLANWQT